MRFCLRTPLDDECNYESTTTLVFEYLRDVNTAKTSIIIQYVEVLEVLKGRPKINGSEGKYKKDFNTHKKSSVYSCRFQAFSCRFPVCMRCEHTAHSALEGTLQGT
jgi:hypothetical protein